VKKIDPKLGEGKRVHHSTIRVFWQSVYINAFVVKEYLEKKCSLFTIYSERQNLGGLTRYCADVGS